MMYLLSLLVKRLYLIFLLNEATIFVDSMRLLFNFVRGRHSGNSLFLSEPIPTIILKIALDFIIISVGYCESIASHVMYA